MEVGLYGWDNEFGHIVECGIVMIRWEIGW